MVPEPDLRLPSIVIMAIGPGGLLKAGHASCTMDRRQRSPLALAAKRDLAGGSSHAPIADACEQIIKKYAKAP